MVNFGPLTAEIDWRVCGTPSYFKGYRVLASLLQRRWSTEVNQILHDVWPSPGLLRYICIFEGSCPLREFFHVQNSLCVRLRTIAQVCRVISSQLRHAWTIGKKLVKQQCLPHMPSQYGDRPLAAEICWRVWGTHANFNGLRVLAALMHGTLVIGVSETAALNRGRHLYSTGRPSRWALAHISSFC